MSNKLSTACSTFPKFAEILPEVIHRGAADRKSSVSGLQDESRRPSQSPDHYLVGMLFYFLLAVVLRLALLLHPTLMPSSPPARVSPQVL